MCSHNGSDTNGIPDRPHNTVLHSGEWKILHFPLFELMFTFGTILDSYLITGWRGVLTMGGGVKNILTLFEHCWSGFFLTFLMHENDQSAKMINTPTHAKIWHFETKIRTSFFDNIWCKWKLPLIRWEKGGSSLFWPLLGGQICFDLTWGGIQIFVTPIHGYVPPTTP